MAKPVSLSVHRNTVARRKSRRLRDEIVDCARLARSRYGDRFDGYAVVVWTDDGEAEAWWDHGGLGPTYILPHVSHILDRKVGIKDAESVIDPKPDKGA